MIDRRDPVDVQAFWGGIWRHGEGQALVRHNPARPAELVAAGQTATPDQLDNAVDAAVAAARSWAATPMPVRCGVLNRAADWLDARADALGEELTREEGKVLAEGTAEVRRAAAILRYFGHQGDREVGSVYASPLAGQRILTAYRPVGTVAVVTPWNFPIAIPAWKIAPALAFGNTVVWKPASHVPLLAYRLVQALSDSGLPSGVLSMVFGSGRLGQALVEHDGIDAVTFTGSTAVGRSIVEACGRLARPVQAELGGKNAVVVADDASLGIAVDAVVTGAFSGNGQKCTATSRVVVMDAVRDEFCDRLAARVRELVVADPLDPATDVGPLVSEGDRDRVAAVLRDVTDAERSLAVAKEVDSDGWYLAPQVIGLDRPTGPLWEEELFAPVVAVTSVPTFDEALAVADTGAYGLIAGVFTERQSRIERAMDVLEVGMMTVNGPTTGGFPHVPFGGWKGSGFGPKEQGTAAREFFTRSQTVFLSTPDTAER